MWMRCLSQWAVPLGIARFGLGAMQANRIEVAHNVLDNINRISSIENKRPINERSLRLALDRRGSEPIRQDSMLVRCVEIDCTTKH